MVGVRKEVRTRAITIAPEALRPVAEFFGFGAPARAVAWLETKRPWPPPVGGADRGDARAVGRLASGAGFLIGSDG